jgi:glycosyltransferase involved in cell wall biosynthesis
VTALRVFLGPIEYAGVVWGYREALRSTGVKALAVTFHHPFGYPADISLRGGRYRRNLQLTLLLPWALRTFHLFHFHGGRSLLPGGLDAPLLRAAGKKIIMQFHGCELRPRRIVQRDPLRAVNVCQHCPGGCPPDADKARLARYWERHADALICHPEFAYLLTRPYYHLPLGVALPPPAPWPTGGGPMVVAHAPSRRAVKGTHYVLQAIADLQREGLPVRLQLLEGLENIVVRRLLAACHIVVDQLLVGWFGVLALEAMALGRPVICYLDDRWARLIPETADLPIVRATPETLKETLASLVQDPVRCQALGLAGRAYIERVYHPVRLGQALLAIYTGTAQPCEPWRAPVRSEIGSETGAGP